MESLVFAALTVANAAPLIAAFVSAPPSAMQEMKLSVEDFIASYLAIDLKSPSGLIWTGHASKQTEGKVKNKPSGRLDRHGYYQTSINGRLYFNHRIVWLIHKGVWPDGEIDHIDGDTKNNGPSNLRVVSRSENLQNTVANGCSWDKENKKWRAYIYIDGGRINLGRFKTKDEAHAAYLAAKAKIHPTAPERCYESNKNVKQRKSKIR